AAGETDMLRRIGFLVGAGDWSEAEETLRDAGATIIATVGVAPVLRLIDKFPAEAQRTSANLLYMRCLAAWARWDWPTMRETGAAAVAVAPETPTPLRAIGLASSAWSDVWSGRLDAALKTAGLAEADARWLGPPPNVRMALYGLLAVLFAMLGRRSDSYGALDEILFLFDDPG